MTTGSRIAALRKQRDWTQAGLADAAGLSASTIAMYETNRRSPDAASLRKLAIALGVHESQITEDDAPAAATAPSPRRRPAQADRALSRRAASPREAAQSTAATAQSPHERAAPSFVPDAGRGQIHPVHADEPSLVALSGIVHAVGEATA